MPVTTAVRNSLAFEGAERLRFRCAGCGQCCHLRIPVTDADVRRLVKGTGLPVRRIVEFVGSGEFEDPGDDLVWVRFSARARRVMCIRELRDRCRFLRAGRCTAYAHRPTTCRTHPFLVTADDANQNIHRVDINNDCKCRGTPDERQCHREVLRLHRWSLRDDERYLAKIRRWNARPGGGTEAAFLSFLGLDGLSTGAFRRRA